VGISSSHKVDRQRTLQLGDRKTGFFLIMICAWNMGAPETHGEILKIQWLKEMNIPML
jgi:hypothetical protein